MSSRFSRVVASTLTACVLTLTPQADAAPPNTPKKCITPKKNELMLLVVSAADRTLLSHAKSVERIVGRALKDRVVVLGPDVTAKALSDEGGQKERESTVVEARVLIRRAEERFRELDDEVALDLIAKATVRLTAVHQEPGATDLLAEAHMLAGAIFLARDRVDGARQRLQRALDLKPDLNPPRHRFAPKVLAELAAVRASQAVRPTGRLLVRLPNQDLTAEVFLDGRHAGQTPLALDSVGAGRHLVRVKAPGFKSFVATIQVDPGEDRSVPVNLIKDDAVEEIGKLPERIRAGTGVERTLRLLGRRAAADRVLLAALVLSEERSAVGTATVGVVLQLPRAGTAYAPNLDASTIDAAVARVFVCDDSGPVAPREAPALLGLQNLRGTGPTPVPEPEAFWQSPWFWAVASVAVLGLSGAAVVARASGGPPESVRVTLVPRP